jgi:YceI-like protein
MSVAHLTLFLFALAGRSPHVRDLASATPIRPESRVWISGASNIRRFTCRARRLSGAIDLRGVTTASPVLTGENASTAPSISVTVEQLDCGIGVMSRHLHETLRAAKHSHIDFRLATYEVDLRAATPVARIAGFVTIAGVRRPVATTAAVRADSLGVLHVMGAYVVRPTEFGVAPPRRFGGLLRVRDRATVHFDIALEPDGGAIDAIECGLLQSVKVDLTREPTHDSHP